MDGMEPVTLVAALVAGATVGLANAASAAVTDAYGKLKERLVSRLRGAGTDDGQATAETLVERATGADSAGADEARRGLVASLTAVGVDASTAQAAQRLLDLLEADGQGKYVVDASQAKGLMIGDHNSQTNTFS
ncbi:hypothetical protein ACFVHW_01260 [Streptomyces sp. NPDC127110]|uniref:hypothetical protein n=1 Tax=Streptomyces sp. NPDC127110 TaxID=3345362 RepID=UPI0036429C2B